MSDFPSAILRSLKINNNVFVCSVGCDIRHHQAPCSLLWSEKIRFKSVQDDRVTQATSYLIR